MTGWNASRKAAGRVVTMMYKPRVDEDHAHMAERRQMEAMLRATQAQLLSALELAHMGHWEYDILADRYTFNDQFYAMFHTSVDEVGGYYMSSSVYIQKFVHPDDIQDVRLEIEKALSTTDPDFSAEMEHRIIYGDGTDGSVLVRYFVVKDEQGRAVSIYGVNQDITDRKKNEQALRESEQKYRGLFEHMTEGFALHEIMTDDEGHIRNYRFLDMNPSFERLTGISRADAIGRTVLDVLPGIDSTWIERYGIVALTGQPIHFDSSFSPHNKWYDIFAYCPAPGQFAVIVTDITERKAAERALQVSQERFRRYFELGTVGMSITSPSKGWLEVNDCLCDILGYARKDLFQLTWAQLTHPDDLLADEQLFNQVLAGEIDGYSLDKRFLRKDGKTVYATISVDCLRAPDGAVEYFVGIIQDITARKMAEDHLKASLNEKEVLLKEIHHRVKNNLQVVSSLLSLQAGQVDDQKAKVALQESQRRVRAMGLIHERLYRSYNLAQVNFAEYLTNVTMEIARSYARESVRASVDAAPVNLQIDIAIPCGLIATELISNAFRHAFPEDRTGSVLVGLRRLDSKTVELKVQDDGIGIPRGYNFEKSSSMGMMLVSSLSSQIGGTITLARASGSCFTVTYPG